MAPDPPRRRRAGALDALEFPASGDARTIVCLHGYGADAADLSGLAREVELERPARWIFPEAPLALPYFPGRAWFALDERRLERAQLGEEVLDFSGDRPEGLEGAVVRLLEGLEDLSVDWSRTILGGFSQGAMVSLEAALRAPEAPAGIFLLSGNLVDEAGLRERAPARAGLRFFQSHGTCDPLLPFAGARRLEALLTEAGLKGRLLPFEGGHAVPREALEGLREFLSG